MNWKLKLALWIVRILKKWIESKLSEPEPEPKLKINYGYQYLYPGPDFTDYNSIWTRFATILIDGTSEIQVEMPDESELEGTIFL